MEWFDCGQYERQIALPEIGEKGQERLRGARVAVIGAGGLGSPAALYLAAAGVGVLGLIDGDRVEVSNLNRQIIHSTLSLHSRKVDSASSTIAALNPAVRVVAVAEYLRAETAERILDDYDFVIDATDNFAAKFLIADTCHALSKPYSHAGIDCFLGQTMTVIPSQTACYRCLFQEPPPPSPGPPRGPLGVVPGVMGAIQAGEALKCVLGIGELLTNRILIVDLLAGMFRTVPVKRQAGCRLCG